MSTRYDELTEILGIGSVGTPSSTPAADDRKQTSRRDELYSMLGEITAQAPDTAETGASTTQRDASLETQTQGASAAGSQAATPQSAAPYTSSGAYAPPSPQGEGRSREQVQQELNDSQTRYKQLLLTAPYAANAQDSAEISKQLKAEQEKIQSLKSELEPLTAPSTNAERDSLIQRMNAITENEGYATTVEQADAVQQEKQDTRQRLHQLDQELGNAARFYDSGERAGAVTKGALKQVGASYEKLLSTTMGANNQLYERSPEIYKAVITNGQPWMLPEDYSPDAEKMREDYQRINDKAKALNESAAKDLAQAKEGLNALGQAGVDLSVNLIQMGIDAAGQAAGLGMLPFFARAAGGSMLEAEQEGADSWGQLGYGLTKGAIEVGTEKLFDGLAGVFGKGAADDVIEGLIGKLSGSNTGRSLLRAIAGAAGEGTEEVISDLLDPFAKLIYNDQALKEAWENRAELRSQMLYDYLIGAAMGGLGSVTGAVTGQYAEKNAALGGMETQGAVVPPSVSFADSSPQGGASAASSQSVTPTAPLAEEPLRAATQGRPYSQPEQGNELNTPQEAQTQAAEAARTDNVDAFSDDIIQKRKREYYEALKNYSAEAYKDESKIIINRYYQFFDEMLENAQETQQPVFMPYAYGPYGRIREIDLGNGVTLFYAPSSEGATAGTYKIVDSDGKVIKESLDVYLSQHKIALEAKKHSSILQSEFNQTSDEYRAHISELEAKMEEAKAAYENAVKENDKEEMKNGNENGRQRAAAEVSPQPAQQNQPYIAEAHTHAAEMAQNAQSATPQAETPPAAQNAAQAASGALNRQEETTAQGQETTAAQNAAPVAYNQTTTPALQGAAGGVATYGGGTTTGESGSVLPYGAKLSRFWENTLQKTENAANAPESVKNPLWYMPKSEAQSLAEAASRLDADKQGTIENLVSAEAWSGVQLDAAAAVADTLYAEGAATGDYSSYTAWRKVMQNHVTDTARGIQALAKYTRTGKGIAMDAVAKIQDSSLSPEQKKAAQNTVVQFGTDLDNATKNKDISGLRELILKMNEHRGTGTFVKGNFEKVLGKVEDAEYLSEYAKRQLEAVAADYTVSEARSLGESLKTWQVNAQLTSLGTFFRNIGGNLSFGAIDSVSQNGFALALDYFVSQKTGKRTVSADKGWFSSEARKQAGDAFYRSILEVAGDVDMGGSATRYGITSGRTFKMSGGKAERFMSRWEQLLSYSLRTSDQVSRGQIEGAVQAGLEGIKNSGLSAEEISQIAESTADYRLFQNEGTAAKLSKGAHDVLNLIGIGGQVNGTTRQGGFGLGDLVNPYPKVPANLAVKALEYSPANIIKGGIELVKLFKTVNAKKATAQTKGQSGGTGQIAPGTVVRALDRGNYGYVQSFDGSTYSVKFTSKDGLVATKRFTPDQIEATNEKTIEEAKRGGKSAVKALDQHQAVMDIARGMTGVPIIALCAALFKSGLVKNFDDEEDYDVMAQNAAEGKTGVQINLDAAMRAFNVESAEWKDGDDLMSISWAEPINAFLAIGSLIANEDDDATIGTYIGDHFSGTLQSVLDMPLMSNLSGAIDTVRYSTAESLGGQMAEGALDYATSTATGFVPAPFRQTARAIDPYYRNTTGDSALETSWKKLANVIPGLRQLALDVKTDNFGQPKENAGGFAQRALNALVLPGAINELNQNDASTTVEAIYEATGDAGVYPDRKAPNAISYKNKKHSLTSEEKQEYQTEAGQTSRDLISALSGSQYYGNLSDVQKAEVVKTINQYAEHKAADNVFDILGIDTKRDKWESLKGKDLINYLTVKELAKGIYDDNGEITDYSAMDELIGGAYSSLSASAKEILSGSYSMLDELSYGKEHGVDSKTVMSAKEKADANGNGSISQEELWYYLGLQKNMSEETKGVLWDILTTGKTGYYDYAEKQK